MSFVDNLLEGYEENLMEGALLTGTELEKLIKKAGSFENLLRKHKRNKVFEYLLKEDGLDSVKDMDTLLDFIDFTVTEGRKLAYLNAFIDELDIDGADFWRGINVGELLEVSSARDKAKLINSIINSMIN